VHVGEQVAGGRLATYGGRWRSRAVTGGVRWVRAQARELTGSRGRAPLERSGK
jgi:hypothetical protein